MVGLFVLETYDGDVYLGELLFDRRFVTVRTDYVGRPPVIASDDVAEIVPAAEHPDVVVTPDESAVTGTTLAGWWPGSSALSGFHLPRAYLDAARLPDADAEVLAGLATLPFDFVHEAIAEHPNATATILASVVPEELRNWGNHSLLRKVVSDPAADDAVLRLARERVAQVLALVRRPYGVAMALAERATNLPRP